MLRHALAAACFALAALASASAQDVLPRRAFIGAAANNSEAGVQVAGVRPGSPAAAAGLAAGDIVTRIGARAIASTQDYVAAVRAARPGAPLAVAITRAGAAQTLTLTPGEAARETAPDLTISYESVRVEDSLRRTLIAAPRGPRQRRPAMLLMGGIGCGSIDDAQTPHAYRALAHDLARRGVIVMRLEKSGVGDSQGPACAGVDFNAELRAYDAALAALRADRRVDPSQVFVFGHSIGTVGAPELAQRHHAAGVIVAQGLGRTWIEYELINTRRQLELAGASPAETDAALITMAECVSRALLAQEPAAELFAARPECQQLLLMPASQAYMAQLTQRNIGGDWSNLAAPALIIYGASDFVTDEADHRRLADLVNAAHPGAATLQIIEGMDHYLAREDSQASSFARATSGQPPGDYDPRFSQVIGDWICARAHCTGVQTANR